MRENDEQKEVQHAVVKVPVALVVDTDASVRTRQRAICRAFRTRPDDFEIRAGLVPDAVDLSGTETMEEAAMRRDGQAEARAEGELDRRRERYFDEHGHF